jgi:predicted DNA-binding transcriptional regulator AlpA
MNLMTRDNMNVQDFSEIRGVQDFSEIRPDTMLTFREWCALVGVGGDRDVVMSLPEWAKLIGISLKNARGMIENGTGPPVVQLSPNRIGIRICDHRAWLTARTRARKTAPLITCVPTPPKHSV